MIAIIQVILLAQKVPVVSSGPVASNASVKVPYPQVLHLDNKGHTCLQFMVIMDNMMLN